MHIEKFKYQGSEVLFDVMPNEAYINATKIAKHFNKKPETYLKTESTREYIEALKSATVQNRDFVVIKRGGRPDEQGTWIHNSLAVDFARWLNPKFAVWCDMKIKEILSQKTLFDSKNAWSGSAIILRF